MIDLIVDSSLSAEAHVDSTTTALFHPRNISKIKNMMSLQDAKILVHVFFFFTS